MRNFPSDYIDANQKKAVDLLRSGSILVGGVGSGKSRTALYFWLKTYGERPLYVITTPHKRDTKDWTKEALHLDASLNRFTVDSWNNIQKYIGVQDAFFIFDEQRLVGKGTWSKAFLKIARENAWIVLTATPGDTWMDYATIFIANGFFRNRTEFCREHAVYSRVARYPKIERYIGEAWLEKLRDQITVVLEVQRKTVRHSKILWCDHDKEAYREALRTRWNIEKGEPYLDGSALCYGLRRIVGRDESRLKRVEWALQKHEKIIVFYNFDYELEMLRAYFSEEITAEWNGHKHEKVPETGRWLYFVQYNAGAEAWECTTCNTILFYSASYSYKIMEQAAGRIDRRNTEFEDLYYYCLATKEGIERVILEALARKRDFNKNVYMKNLWLFEYENYSS